MSQLRPSPQTDAAAMLSIGSGLGGGSHHSRNSSASLSRSEGDSSDDECSRNDTNNNSSRPVVANKRMRFNATEDLEASEQQQHNSKEMRGMLKKVSYIDSPFQNLGKTSAQKAQRSTFLPESSRLNNDAETYYPTYKCPRCGKKTREFFSINDAPRQLQGPSGYLAVYFAIYVIASLFIFGLEEGWEPLDCIYFAVVTLTTAGLGDFVPTTDANKIICSVFIYFGVACIGLLLGSYIAGMLDERANRDRKSKLIASCPNCARLKTLKGNDAVILQRKGAVLSRIDPSQVHRFHTERGNTARHEVLQLPADFRSVHRRHPSKSPDFLVRSHPTHSKQNGGSFELGGPPRVDSMNGIDRPLLKRDSSDRGSSTSVGSSFSRRSLGKFSSHVLGSPVTRQILGRQRHTRHGSIDITGSNYGHSKSFGSGITRKYSMDGDFQTPVGKESTTPRPLSHASDPALNHSSIETTDRALNDDCTEDDDDDDDESIVTTGSSSCSSTDELLSERQTKLKTAKYVFVTLRRALANSIVIIAVGCIGFCLIEGFSLVDSWYFTTVFLTTVGYGDIRPVTKGGKLFATVYILVAGTILLNNMSQISEIPLELRRKRLELAVLTQFGDQLDDSALRELATGPVIQRLRLTGTRTDGLDECTREMFSLAMLVRMGKVSEEEIRQAFAAFRRLDVNDEGVLNSKSIIAGMIQKSRSQALSAQRGIPPPPGGYYVGSQGSQNINAPNDEYYSAPPAAQSESKNESSALLPPIGRRLSHS
jgi:voltage-gated potassium channel